jgi:hypothetical protein
VSTSSPTIRVQRWEVSCRCHSRCLGLVHAATLSSIEEVETFTMLSSQSKQKEEDTLDSDVHEWPVVLYCTTTVVLLLLVLYTLHIYFFKNIYTCSSKQL